MLVCGRVMRRGPVLVMRRWDCNEKNLKGLPELPVVAVPIAAAPAGWKAKLRVYAELGESVVRARLGLTKLSVGQASRG